MLEVLNHKIDAHTNKKTSAINNPFLIYSDSSESRINETCNYDLAEYNKITLSIISEQYLCGRGSSHENDDRQQALHGFMISS